MAEPKRGSVEAFKASEKRRQDRIASKRGSLFGKAGSKLPERVKKKREEFNKKVAAINKKNVDQESVKKFRAAEERRQIRLKEKNPNNKVISKKVTKRLQANENKKRAQADVEKDLPKSKITTGATVGATGPLLAAKAKTIQGKDKPKPIAKSPDVKGALSSFGEAFKAARAKGVGTKFAYNDKMYSAVTKDDISRAGKTNLKEFLNAAKRKDTKLAKAPGQITDRNRGQLKRGGGVDVDKAKEFRKNRKTPIRTFVKNTLEGKYMDRRKSTVDPREAVGNRRVINRMKTGGSVMARGCKMGRKKATKIY